MAENGTRTIGENNMNDLIVIPNAPSIQGLTFRHFRGEEDYATMVDLIAACKGKDGVERSTDTNDVARTYRHLINCDPQTDMLFAEVDGKVIGYGRIWWENLLDGIRLYHPFGFLHPDWRGIGIGNAMFEAAELRAYNISGEHPKEAAKFLQVEPQDSEKDLISLLERRGYKPARY
jgi:GNAT superfamily N-acetyltransferase